MGENTDMSYLIKEGGELFKVTTDVNTQEAVVSIKKVCLVQGKILLPLFMSVKQILSFTAENNANTLTLKWQ